MTVENEYTDFSHSRFCILGYGQFGRRALKALNRLYPHAGIHVIDRQPVRDEVNTAEVIQADAVDWLLENSIAEITDMVIIPALPIHLTAEWLKQKLKQQQAEVKSVEIPEKFFNVCRTRYALNRGRLQSRMPILSVHRIVLNRRKYVPSLVSFGRLRFIAYSSRPMMIRIVLL